MVIGYIAGLIDLLKYFINTLQGGIALAGIFPCKHDQLSELEAV